MDKTVLTVLLVLFQVADAVTTYLVIRDGKGTEANPALVWLQKFLSKYTSAKWAWLAVAKAVGIAGSLLFLFSLPADAPYAELLIAAFVAFYAWVIMNNISLLD